MQENVMGFIIVAFISSWLAWNTYEYLKYKTIGRIFNSFFEWSLYYTEHQSKIWIDKVIVLVVSSTIMMAIPVTLVVFWALIITLPFIIL